MNRSAWGHRPLSRYAARAAAALAGGRRWSHRQDWWPGLRLDLPDGEVVGAAFYRGKRLCDLQPMQSLAAKQDEITIIGSGPSVATQVFSSLPANSAILLNGAIHLLDGRLAPPLAVVVEDERFVWRHFGQMVNYIADGTVCIFSTAVLRAISEVEPAWLARLRTIHVDFVQKPYGKPRRSPAELAALDYLRWSSSSATAISLAPRRGVFAGGSVATTALQVALALRPVRLGFAGIDLSNAGQPRFYETVGPPAMSRIANAEARILEIFALAQSEIAARGAAIVNYSPVSALARLGIPYDDRLAVKSRHGSN